MFVAARFWLDLQKRKPPRRRSGKTLVFLLLALSAVAFLSWPRRRRGSTSLRASSHLRFNTVGVSAPFPSDPGTPASRAWHARNEILVELT